jgi:DNA mismatch repair protein MutH
MRPPRTEAELLARAEALEGRTLGWIAERLDIAVPRDLRRQKGWIGELMEAALGATGGATAQRDFPELGIELKTIPVGPDGHPRESTFVCTAPLDAELLADWEETWVRAKLARVLWVPVVDVGPPGQRPVGAAVLWSPSPEQEAMLQADWEELADLLGLGHYDMVDARWGEALQVRPKAANSSERCWALDADAQWVQVNPRGFYLRTSFTREILAAAQTRVTPT